MIEWHDRESAADQDGIDPSDRIDERSVFFMIDAQGLKGALETMDEVNGEGKNTDEIEGYNPYFLESYIDPAIDILNSFVMSGVGNHGELVRKSHFDPKITHMEAQECKNEDAEQGHVFGGPCGPGHFSACVFRSLGDPVGPGKQDSLDRMEQDKGVKSDRNDLDQGVVRHESRVDIEGFASVVCQQLQVAGHVYYQEENQKKAGEAHNHLLAKRGGEKTGKPVHNRICLKSPAR